jgi:hypothetical protein
LGRGDVASIYWIEAKDVAKDPAAYNIAPASRYLVQEVNSSEGEKHYCETRTDFGAGSNVN